MEPNGPRTLLTGRGLLESPRSLSNPELSLLDVLDRARLDTTCALIDPTQV
jgi:hypothetical protein